MFDSNEKFIHWVLTRISPEKINQFDTNLEPIMSNSVTLKQP